MLTPPFLVRAKTVYSLETDVRIGTINKVFPKWFRIEMLYIFTCMCNHCNIICHYCVTPYQYAPNSVYSRPHAKLLLCISVLAIFQYHELFIIVLHVDCFADLNNFVVYQDLNWNETHADIHMLSVNREGQEDLTVKVWAKLDKPFLTYECLKF